MFDTFPNYEYANYDMIKPQVENVVKKFKVKFSKLKSDFTKFDLNKSIKNNNAYTKLVTDVLKAFIRIFPEIKKNKVLIFLHGSLARGTSTLFSDVDFTFCYDNKLRNTLIPIEEIICVAMIEIFNLGKRSKVHPIMNNFENLYKENLISDITFLFGNDIIKYDDRIYKYKSIYDAINSSRDINFIMDIYKSKISSTTFKEFCYSYKQIYCNYNPYDYSYNINNVENLQTNISNKNLLSMIESEINNVKNCISKMNIGTDPKVCEIKSLIKSNPNTMFYNLLCILRRYLNKNYNYNHGININLLKNKKVRKLLSKQTCSNLYRLFHLKNWYLSKAQYVFHIEKLNLSGENFNNLNMENLKALYYKHHNQPFDEVTTNIYEFYNSLLNIYNKLKECFYE